MKKVPKMQKVVNPARKTALVVEELDSINEKVIKGQVFEKQNVYTPVPVPKEYVRVIVLKDYRGMLNDLYAGDIIDVPVRRYKTLIFRGLVKEYTGYNNPNKQR